MSATVHPFRIVSRNPSVRRSGNAPPELQDVINAYLMADHGWRFWMASMASTALREIQTPQGRALRARLFKVACRYAQADRNGGATPTPRPRCS